MCRGLLFVVFGLFCLNAVAFQDSLPTSVAISIQEVDSALQLGYERQISDLRVGVLVSIQNDSTQSVPISINQFQLLADDKALIQSTPGSASPLELGEVKPQQSSKGWIWFVLPSLSGNEPSLKLVWNPTAQSTIATDDLNNPVDSAKADDSAIRIDINKEVRRLCAIEKTLIGPDGCLQQISVARSLDVLSAWALKTELRTIGESDVRRIVFVPAQDAKLNVTGDFTDWLALLIETPGGVVTSPSPLSKPGVTFQHIGVAGFTESTNRRSAGQRLVSRHRSIDDAVCLALTSVYRFVPIDQAIADLRSPNPGIRRAALAGAVDRLSSDQATAILDQARTGSEDVQLEIASYLNLIPGKSSVEALKDMCLGANAKVVAVALRSLCRSHDDAAAVAMADIWKAGEDSPSLRSETISAIIEISDDRWVPLVADFASQVLKQSTQPNESVPPNDPISSALEFLQARNDSSTLMSAEQELLSIRSAAIQDMFLGYLLRSAQPGSEKVIRQCVNQRLNAGHLSPSVTAAAIQFRDPLWAPPLLKSFRAKDSEDAPDFRVFQAILACASTEVLEDILAQSESVDPKLRLEPQQQFEMVKHLAQIDHPKWRRMAEQLLESPGQRASELIQLLGVDASEESLLILRIRLQRYADSLEGTPDASVDGQHLFQTLTAYVATFAHPECRRLMNRLSRNSNSYVSELATSRKRNSLARSPARVLIQQELTLRREGKIKEAMEVLNQCVELDPMTAELFVHRSSVLLHENHFSESMEDLRTADRLSPEDVEVQSMIALVMVRLDDIEGGLKSADDVITMAPKDWTALYNGACTFARATESPTPTAEMKQRYADRGILLLRQTAELKFDDPDHMVKDEDLLSLHDHSEWSQIVDLVRANKDAALSPALPGNVPPGLPVPAPVPPNPNPK